MNKNYHLEIIHLLIDHKIDYHYNNMHINFMIWSTFINKPPHIILNNLELPVKQLIGLDCDWLKWNIYIYF